MFDHETLRLLAEADEALRIVYSHQLTDLAGIAALGVLAIVLLRMCRKPKKRERIFRELF